MSAWDIPPGIMCENCGQHPASIVWTEGILAATHGSYAHWCKICALKVQIKTAEEAVARLPKLLAELEEERERSQEKIIG